MKSLSDLYKHDKPREKLILKGAGALRDFELMALILGRGTKGRDVLKLSRDVVKIFDDGFDKVSFDRLSKTYGLGEAGVCKILASMELAKRHLIKQNKKIITSKDAYMELKKYAHKQQEYFLSITLDGASHLIETRVVFIGTLNKSIIHPREIFADAINDRAASIIIAHTHPSGEISPSLQDEMISDKLVGVGEMVGIDVVDHLILGKSGYFSFKDEKKL